LRDFRLKTARCLSSFEMGAGQEEIRDVSASGGIACRYADKALSTI